MGDSTSWTVTATAFSRRTEWNAAMVDWDVDHNGSLDTDEMSV